MPKIPEINKKAEVQMFSIYAVIGVALTALTYILWTLILFFLEQSGANSPENISIAYFVSSFTVIGLSLIANRKITFKNSERTHKSKLATVFVYYLTYASSALIASCFSFLAIKFFGELTPLIIIQFLTIVINTGLNYLSQRFLIFKVGR